MAVDQSPLEDFPAGAAVPRGLVVALDGPASSGKSSVGAAASARLGYRFCDTGLLYRAVTWLAIHRRVAPDETTELVQLVDEIHLLDDGTGRLAHVAVDDVDRTAEVRGPEVDVAVSSFSSVAVLRAALLHRQRGLIGGGRIIMAGRDIGTVVLPDADLKIFLDASVEERAGRRARERGVEPASLAGREILQELRRRDQLDSTRAVAPLRAADDAVVFSTDGNSFEMTVSLVVNTIRRAEAERALREGAPAAESKRPPEAPDSAPAAVEAAPVVVEAPPVVVEAAPAAVEPAPSEHAEAGQTPRDEPEPIAVQPEAVEEAPVASDVPAQDAPRPEAPARKPPRPVKPAEAEKSGKAEKQPEAEKPAEAGKPRKAEKRREAQEPVGAENAPEAEEPAEADAAASAPAAAAMTPTSSPTSRELQARPERRPMIPTPVATKLDPLVRFGSAVLRLIVRAIVRLRVEGDLGAIPRDGPLIVAANHASSADPVLIGAFLNSAINRPLNWLGKRELTEWAATGWAFRRAGIHPVDRNAADRESFRTAMRILEAGQVLAVFPEGTRSRDGALQQVREGVGLLALRSGAKVLPVAVVDSDRMWPRGRLVPRVGRKVTVRYGTAFDVGAELAARGEAVKGRAATEAATRLVMARIATLLPPRQRGVYADVAAPSTERNKVKITSG
jgi:CMP/dCMP kinase